MIKLFNLEIEIRGGESCELKCRGDLPFCSEECRQQQIEADEAKETNRKLSVTASSRRELEDQKQKQKQKQSSPKSQKITLVAG